MKRALVAAILATMLLAITAQAATDPRKCTYSSSAKVCTQAAAIAALKRTMAAHGFPGWDANLACAAQSAKLLVWRCAWTSGTPGSATITFRALANGWHTRVALAS